MSEVTAAGSPGGPQDVRFSIARAALATGMDFNYLLAQARLESNLNPQARAGSSSAAGLYQFLGNTWLDTLDRHGAQHGMGWAGAAINEASDGTKIVDPALRGQIMALRFDPDASSLMAAELAKDNQAALRGTLGREPDFAELYLAHFLGSDGASRFLSAMQANPGASAADLFPKAASANRGVFYTEGGAARSLSEVMELFRAKLDRAGGDGAFDWSAIAASQPGAPTFDRPMGPLAREFAQAAQGHAPQTRTSMLDTLRKTFGGSGATSANALPDNVRGAYNKFKAFPL